MVYFYQPRISEFRGPHVLLKMEQLYHTNNTNVLIVRCDVDAELH